VALSADGKPEPIPPIVPETEDDKRRNKEAEKRRSERLRKLGKK